MVMGWTHDHGRLTDGLLMPGPGPGATVLKLAGIRAWRDINLWPGDWSTQQGLILPLWVFLPAAIPPVLWWKRRKRISGGRGFAVVTSATVVLKSSS